MLGKSSFVRSPKQEVRRRPSWCSGTPCDSVERTDPAAAVSVVEDETCLHGHIYGSAVGAADFWGHSFRFRRSLLLLPGTRMRGEKATAADAGGSWSAASRSRVQRTSVLGHLCRPRCLLLGGETFSFAPAGSPGRC